MRAGWVRAFVLLAASALSGLWASGSVWAAATEAPRVETAYLAFAGRGPDVGDDLDAVQQRRDWLPYTGVLSLGYSPDPYWVRVTLREGGLQGPLVLRLRPSFLDDVRVFLPRPGGGFDAHALGDQQTQDDEQLHDAALTIDLPAALGTVETQFFIRLQTTSARMAGIQVLSLVRAEQARILENTLMGLYFGIMMCLLAWSLSHAVLDRDPVFGWYTAYQAASTMMNFGLLGYARLYLPAGWSADLWTTGFVVSISVLAPAFHLSLLKSMMAPAAVPGLIRWSLLIAMALAGLNLLRLGLGGVGQALAFNANLVSLLAISLGLLVVILALRERHSPLRRVMLGYVLLCLSTLFTLLPLLGVVKGGSWTLFSTSTHSLMLALLLGAMLMVRGQELKRTAELSRQQVAEEQARTRQAQSERDDKDRFLSMLTHELRTPLSVIRMVIDGARRREESSGPRRQLDLARSAVVDIDQVIEATVQVDRLERSVLESRRVECDLGELSRLCVVSLGTPASQRVRLQVPDHPVTVSSDPVLLRLIVGNLLDNALKYSPPNAVVEMTVAAGEPGAEQSPLVRVANPPGRAGRPDARRVFAKYYRSEGAQHSTGSGQGLYLVEGLARHLGLVATCDPGNDHDPESPVRFELRWRGRANAVVDPDR